MSGIFGGGNVSKAAPEASSIRITTSSYGRPIPLAWGRVRVSGFMMWYGDFKAIAHEQDVGGKGGMSGASVNYTYEAAVAIGLVEGPINNVPRVWRGKEDRTSTTTSSQVLTKQESFYVAEAGGVVTLSPPGTMGTVQSVIVSWGTFDTFDSVTLTAGTHYTQSGASITFAANPVLGSRQVTVNYTYTKAAAADAASTLLGLTVFKGTYTQTPWTHLTTNHAAEAISYPGIAYVAAPTFNLGSSSDMPNMGFEIETAHGHSATIPDVNPRDFIVDFLTNPYYGAYFPSDKIGDLTNYSNYCIANGLFLSPDYTEQAEAGETLGRTAALTNSDWAHVDGKFVLVPYADQAVTGNGVTWTPNLTAQYELGPDDFVDQGASGPIVIERKDPSQRYNVMTLQFKDRDLQYNDNVAEGRDEAEIAKNGIRPAPQKIEAPEIKTASVADTAVNLMVQRAVNVCNDYRFVLKANKAPLAPLDLVALTHPGYPNMTQRLVRIVEIREEASTGDLQCLAEEVPVGTASSILYPLQTPTGYTTNYNVAPSATSTPLIFEIPSDLSPETGLQLAVAATSVGAHWGGCQVWVSLDNASYKLMGVIRGGSRYGTLTAAVGATALVQLANTNDQLLSGSASDLANLATLCYIPAGASPEYFAYQTATLTGLGAYTLSTLSRGAYGTVSHAHAPGDGFVRVDDRVLLSEPMAPSTIGKTIYFKLCSFNEFEAATQSLAEVSAVAYTVTGKHRRTRSFRAIARGTSDTGSPVAIPGLYYPDTGAAVAQVGGAPNYLVVRITLSSGFVEASTFDLTASGATLAANAAAMASYLNATPTTCVVVVVSWGNAQLNRLSGGIPEAMYRCGASRSVFASPTFKAGSAYLLVGVPGSGEGNGVEAYQGNVDGATSAWCDVFFQLKDGRVVFGAPTPTTSTLSATEGKSLSRPLEAWDLMGHSIVDVGSTGKVGSRALYLGTLAGAFPRMGELRAIDAARKYRTRFWARPDATADGQLFFSLRQYTDSVRTPGPVNSGRSPYKPGGVTKAAHVSAFGANTWGEYSYVWDSADWQANVRFVEPEFLSNHLGTTGGWHIQDFTFEEVTEVVAAQNTATNAASAASTAQTNATSALSTLAIIRSNGYLDAADKPRVIGEWNAIAGEYASISAQGTTYGLPSLKSTYDTAYSALGSYLSSLSPGWSDTTTDTPIIPATDAATWLAYYNARQALLNAVADEAAKRAVWATVTGTGRPSDYANNSSTGGYVNADPTLLRPDMWAHSNTSGAPAAWAGNFGAGEGLWSVLDKAAGGRDDIFSESMPISLLRTYTIEAWLYKWATTSAAHYLFVEFKDATGAVVTTSTGWLATGAYNFWGLAGTAPVVDGPNKYTFTFGRFGAGTIPTSAVTMRVGILGSYSGSGRWSLGSIRVREATDLTTLVSNTWRAAGTMEVVGNTAIKASGSGAWDSAVSSKDSFTGGCYVSFVPAQNNLSLMIGLNADPTTDANFTSIDYALYCKSDGTLDVYSAGVLTVANIGSYAAGDVLGVGYNGYRFVFLRNGAELSSITNTAFASVVMYADSSFFSVGAKVTALSFGPLSKVSDIATGQLGAGAVTANTFTDTQTSGAYVTWPDASGYFTVALDPSASISTVDGTYLVVTANVQAVLYSTATAAVSVYVFATLREVTSAGVLVNELDISILTGSLLNLGATGGQSGASTEKSYFFATTVSDTLVGSMGGTRYFQVHVTARAIDASGNAVSPGGTVSAPGGAVPSRIQATCGIDLQLMKR